jgi:hypothetical protein
MLLRIAVVEGSEPCIKINVLRHLASAMGHKVGSMSAMNNRYIWILCNLILLTIYTLSLRIDDVRLVDMPEEQPNFEHQIAELRELAADPTLESCCRRDLEDQIRVAKVKATLAPQDRSQTRQRLASAVVTLPCEPEQDYRNHDNDFEDIEQLRIARLKQLQDQARHRALLEAEGHGTVSSVSERSLRPTVEESSASHIVCLIAVEGDEAGSDIAEFLEVFARKYSGTRFLLCLVRPSSWLPNSVGLASLPGLVCFKNAISIATIPVGQDESEVHEADLEAWLHRRKMLLTCDEAWASAAKRSSDKNETNRDFMGATTSSENYGSDDEDKGDDWAPPCEICGRRYPHQHVRSMYRNELSDSDID